MASVILQIVVAMGVGAHHRVCGFDVQSRIRIRFDKEYICVVLVDDREFVK